MESGITCYTRNAVTSSIQYIDQTFKGINKCTKSHIRMGTPCRGEGGGTRRKIDMEASVNVRKSQQMCTSACVRRDLPAETKDDEPWLMRRVGDQATHWLQKVESLEARRLLGLGDGNKLGLYRPTPTTYTYLERKC